MSTVRCLPEILKERIFELHLEGYSKKYIADYYSRSERTIGRVLAEKGVISSTQQHKETALQVMTLLKRHEITLLELPDVLASYRANKQNNNATKKAALFKPIPTNA